MCSSSILLFIFNFSVVKVVGCHYLQPKETYHEPTRRFYPNEILRSPVTEYVPIELIHGRCWVVDPSTYCKGRPEGIQNID